MTKKIAYATTIIALSNLGNYDEVISILQKELDNLERKTIKARTTRALKRSTNPTRNYVLTIINESEVPMIASEVFAAFTAQHPEEETTIPKIRYQLSQLTKDNLIYKESRRTATGAKAVTYSRFE